MLTKREILIAAERAEEYPPGCGYVVCTDDGLY